MGTLLAMMIGPAVTGILPFAAPSQAKLAWKCAKVVMSGANTQREEEMKELKRELLEIERLENEVRNRR